VAIQFICFFDMDCFVATLLAMTIVELMTVSFRCKKKRELPAFLMLAYQNFHQGFLFGAVLAAIGFASAFTAPVDWLLTLSFLVPF
jgi:hypothetical protein